MHDKVNHDSYFTADGDDLSIYGAITEAARRIHQYVQKEMGGFWRVTDTTSLQFAPTVQEYDLPPDCRKITRFRVKMPSDLTWQIVNPLRLTDDPYIALESYSGVSASSSEVQSPFSYDGPYLRQSNAKLQAGNVPMGPYTVRIAPAPQDIWLCELIYPSAFVEMVNANSFNVIPMEGHGCQVDLAVAEITRNNNDTLADIKEKQGMNKLTEFLTFVRGRQEQQPRVCEPYISDLDN
jgi:hypothetical protein